MQPPAPLSPDTSDSEYSPSSCTDDSSDASEDSDEEVSNEESDLSAATDAYGQLYKAGPAGAPEPFPAPILPEMIPGVLHRAIGGYAPAAVLQFIADRSFDPAKYGLTRGEHKRLVAAYRERAGTSLE